jgi:hypothetical protein
MEEKELKIEQIMANRFELENEYNAIKAHLLQKINRMEEIEHEIGLIDEELNVRSKAKTINVTE